MKNLALAFLLFGGSLACTAGKIPVSTGDGGVGGAGSTDAADGVDSAVEDRADGDVEEILDGGSDADGVEADAAPTGPPPLPGWTLVWNDELDTPGLPDPSKWGYEEGYVRNNELQYYTRERRENARVENGELVIEARRDNFEGHAITSASLNTRGKRHFLYGRIEVRAKLPTGLGTWPAIWMLGTNIGEVGWPTCGEIDIMENVGFDPRRLHGTVHTQAYNHAIGTARGGSTERDTPWDDYHVYAVEWFPDHIDFFVDDERYFTFANEGGNDKWPFDKEHYLLINFAFGGLWGGASGVDEELLPLTYHIDYVRAYERAE